MESKKPIFLTAIVVFILLIFSGALLVSFVQQKQNSPSFYNQGLEYYNKEDFQNAYYNFNKILPTSDLYFNALYRQAKSADALSDTKTALSKYLLLEKLIKDENITPFVLWRISNIYYENKDFKQAKKYFLKLKNAYKDSEYGIASNYMLSKTETNPEIKKEYLLEYIKYSPKGKFAKDVLISLLSDESFNLNSMEKVILANCLYENGAYRHSVEILKEVPIDISWVSLLKSLDKLNSSKNIIKVADKGFNLDNSHFDEDTLYEAVTIFLKHSTDSANDVFNKVSDRRIRAIALYKEILSSKTTEGLSRKKAYFCETYPDSKYAHLVLYSLFIDAMTANKTPLALKYGRLHLSRYRNKTTTPAILYFVSLLKKKTMDSSYKDNLNTLLAEYPNNYYTYRAYSTLVNKNFANKRSLKISKKTGIEFPYKENKTQARFFENFAKTGDINSFEDFRINDPVLKSWVEYKKGNRALSSVLARDYINNSDILPKRNEVVWKLSYPVYYANEINKYSSLRQLNPYLILSLIKEESHFNPDIRSDVGATGLMQIMPSTAEMVAGERHTVSELTNEELNIKLGTKYFEYLMDEFSNNEPLCVLSYNSGPNAVKRWLKTHNSLQFDLMVENIPYNETKDYIKKVYTAYWNYLLTYEGIKI